MSIQNLCFPCAVATLTTFLSHEPVVMKYFKDKKFHISWLQVEHKPPPSHL